MKTKKVDVVAGYSYPNDKNALWFDQNTNTMRYWDGEKWESSQSQGSSLPTPTAEDSSKIMQVTPIQKGTRIEETVMVPEQTCNMKDVGKQTVCTLQNVDESFGEGFVGIAILDGIEYNVEWLMGDTGFCINESVTIGHILTPNFELVDDNHGLTHTIKVIARETEPIYDYNWAPGVKIPVPTAEDVGKVLKVVDKETQTTERVIIVPKQTVSLSRNPNLGKGSWGLIDNWNSEIFNQIKDSGYEYTVEIDNDIFAACQLEDIGDGMGITIPDNGGVGFYNSGNCYLHFGIFINISATIKVYTDIPVTHHEYVWEMVDEDVSQADPGDVIDPGHGDK